MSKQLEEALVAAMSSFPSPSAPPRKPLWVNCNCYQNSAYFGLSWCEVLGYKRQEGDATIIDVYSVTISPRLRPVSLVHNGTEWYQKSGTMPRSVRVGRVKGLTRSLFFAKPKKTEDPSRKDADCSFHTAETTGVRDGRIQWSDYAEPESVPIFRFPSPESEVGRYMERYTAAYRIPSLECYDLGFADKPEWTAKSYDEKWEYVKSEGPRLYRHSVGHFDMFKGFVHEMEGIKTAFREAQAAKAAAKLVEEADLSSPVLVVPMSCDNVGVPPSSLVEPDYSHMEYEEEATV